MTTEFGKLTVSYTLESGNNLVSFHGVSGDAHEQLASLVLSAPPEGRSGHFTFTTDSGAVELALADIVCTEFTLYSTSDRRAQANQ